MSIFDGIRTAENAMKVHRFRSEVAAENIANVNTPGYHRKIVDIRASSFKTELDRHGKPMFGADHPAVGSNDAMRAGVAIAGTRSARTENNERQHALLGVFDMMQAKSAFELSVKSASMLKSMALSSLEIGRGA